MLQQTLFLKENNTMAKQQDTLLNEEMKIKDEKSGQVIPSSASDSHSTKLDKKCLPHIQMEISYFVTALLSYHLWLKGKEGVWSPEIVKWYLDGKNKKCLESDKKTKKEIIAMESTGIVDPHDPHCPRMPCPYQAEIVDEFVDYLNKRLLKIE